MGPGPGLVSEIPEELAAVEACPEPRRRVPTLKLVTFTSPGRDLKEDLQQILLSHIEEGHVLPLFGGALLAYTTASPMEIRDWLRDALSSDDRLFVVEFERWSGYGESEAWKWLLWRGH